MLFIAADGDGIGKLVGRAVIANDVDKLHKVSARIDAAQDFILHWAKQNDGIKISGGGDEFTAAIPKEAIDQIEKLRKDVEYAFGYTISIGIGKNLSEAGTALLIAKLRGKDRIVHFTDKLQEEIKKAKTRVKKGKASQEEYKLAEAYLEKSEGKDMAEKPEEQECAYCDQSDGTDPDHCKYCHDAEMAADEAPCKYCAENEAKENECPYCKDATEGADCTYCKQNEENADQVPHGKSPDSTNATAPAGSEEEKAQANSMGMNPPIQGKPELGNNSSPSGIGEAGPGSAGSASEQPDESGKGAPNEKESIPQEGAHSKEALQAIAQAIEGQTPEGKPEEKEIADDIDDANIIGDKTEGNISRPEDYGSNKPGDMGMGGGSQHPDEDHDNSPDLANVLREGLEDGADSMQREKVVQMCSQALMGFKGCKDIIEQSKTQSPQLYQSSIMMLKAMIEMAKLLGLEKEGSEGPLESQGEQVVGDLGGESENEWHDPFPKHPDQGGERKPGHAAGREAAAGPPQH